MIVEILILVIAVLGIAGVYLAVKRTRLSLLTAKAVYFGLLGGLGAGVSHLRIMKSLQAWILSKGAPDSIVEALSLTVGIAAVMMLGAAVWPRIARLRESHNNQPILHV